MRSFFLGCPASKKDGLEIARIIFPEEKDTTQTFSDDATVQKRSCDSAKSAGELQIYVRYMIKSPATPGTTP